MDKVFSLLKRSAFYYAYSFDGREMCKVMITENVATSQDVCSEEFLAKSCLARRRRYK